MDKAHKAKLMDGTALAARVLDKSFADSYVEYEVFFCLDTNSSKRDIVTLKNDVMINCWRALNEADMTFSTDVTTALDVTSVPAIHIEGLEKGV